MGMSGEMKPLGNINGYDVIAALPDRRNGTPGRRDAYAIVAVRESDGEAVCAWASEANSEGWENGEYYFSGTRDENVARATRRMVERAGWAQG
jgi:hypothetical protein